MFFQFFSGKFVQWKVIIGAYELKPFDYNEEYEEDFREKMKGVGKSPPPVGPTEVSWSGIGAFLGISAVALI